MVGVAPKQSGRIVVADEDVGYFEAVGWMVIEPTDLPLSGVNVPGKAEKTSPEASKVRETTDELLAKIWKANTPQLKAILNARVANADVDALDDLDTVGERREAVELALGLASPKKDGDGDGDGEEAEYEDEE
jgi:hypothetical protein